MTRQRLRDTLLNFLSLAEVALTTLSVLAYEHSHEHSGKSCCSSTKSNHSHLTPKNQEISKNINFSS